MRLSVSVRNDLPAFMKRNVDIGARAVSIGVAGAAQQVKSGWRDQVVSAGLGPKLAKSIRSAVYPKGQASPNAAALIWSKAPKLVSAHNTGPLIRSQAGFWLAIPLPAAGKGGRGGRITPGEWEQRTGKRLRFVYRSGRSALLVDDGTTTGARLMSRSGYHRSPRGFKNKTIPIFALVPQVKLKKRLDLESVARDAGFGLPARIRSAWKSQT